MGFFDFTNSKFKEKKNLKWILPWRNINISSSVIYTDENSLMVCAQFRGPDTASLTAEEIYAFNNSINNVIKMMPTGFVVYFDSQRKISKIFEKSEMPNDLLQKFEDERENYYNGQEHYDSYFYLTFYYLPPPQMLQKITDAFISSGEKQSKAKDNKPLAETEKRFKNSVSLWLSMLEKVLPDIHIMSVNEELSYLHSIISNTDQPIQYQPYRLICEYLADTGFLTGREPKLGDQHMRIITLLSFKPFSTPGMFEEFNKLNFEYRWVSRYVCLSKLDAQKELRNYQSLWGQQLRSLFTMVRDAITQTPTNVDPDEGALQNKEDATMALHELAADNVAFGYYTMVFIVKDKDKKRCVEKANMILEIIQSLGFTGYIETDNSATAWYSSLPGVREDTNCRRPIVSSLNFCHLAPLTSVWSGDKRNNYLKGAVLLYTDTSGSTPFRLSLHVGDLGHTMVVGPSGAGKSVFLNTIEAHFMKYKNSNVFIFDKSMSSRALTLAVGGNFYNLAAEGSGELSFQPLAKIDDEDEMKWAKEWITNYLKTKNMEVSPAQEQAIWKALNSLSVMPDSERTITRFCEFVMDEDVRLTLQPLTENGSYGKLFDNNKDMSGAGRWQVFEMETLMNTPAIVPTTLDYLFHRIETSLKASSGPSIIVLDECWLFFDNPVFKNKLREYFKDMRKKNTSIIFATQNLADIANKPELMTTIMENCPSRVYLPNVNAINEQNRVLYRSFGCNDTQVNLISQMVPKRDYYYSSQKGNRIFQLALQPIELPFVTATSKTDQQKIDEILADKPSNEDFIHKWLEYKEFLGEWNDYKINYLRK